jgi:hypothetical protein
VDGLAGRDLLIEQIGGLFWAIFDAGPATGTLVLDDVPGTFGKGDVKVTHFPFYADYFRVCDNFNIWMTADLDHFRCEDSYGAVIGRKGLVELGHVASDARTFLDQIDPESGGGHIEGGLNAADSATDDHHVSEIAFDRDVLHLSSSFRALQAPQPK